MTEDYTYCKDPDRSLRNLKRKFNVLSVEEGEMNNDILCPGHAMACRVRINLIIFDLRESNRTNPCSAD